MAFHRFHQAKLAVYGETPPDDVEIEQLKQQAKVTLSPHLSPPAHALFLLRTNPPSSSEDATLHRHVRLRWRLCARGSTTSRATATLQGIFVCVYVCMCVYVCVFVCVCVSLCC
jgi:hypothetical protein